MDNNNGGFKGNMALMIVIVMCTMMIPYIYSYSIASNTSNDSNTKSDVVITDKREIEYKDVTLETAELEKEIRIDDIDEVYNEKGELKYRVDFAVDYYISDVVTEVIDEDSSSLKTIHTKEYITCEIPAREFEKLNKKAYYKAKLEISYFKEYYDRLLSDKKNKYIDTVDLETIKITSIDFMFSDYIIDGISSLDGMTDSMIKKYIHLKEGKQSI